MNIYDLPYHVSPYILPENIGYLKIFIPSILNLAIIIGGVCLAGFI